MLVLTQGTSVVILVPGILWGSSLGTISGHVTRLVTGQTNGVTLVIPLWLSSGHSVLGRGCCGGKTQLG